ncbi:alpha-2-macroglobulin family protein [Solilutibacter tolerans]|uniref:alpha-2-macroglobulin family protein n=1 Tax=Solilutibacter tolerans TaxID=1604334 RepID=UPI003CCD7F83
MVSVVPNTALAEVTLLSAPMALPSSIARMVAGAAAGAASTGAGAGVSAAGGATTASSFFLQPVMPTVAIRAEASAIVRCLRFMGTPVEMG